MLPVSAHSKVSVEDWKAFQRAAASGDFTKKESAQMRSAVGKIESPGDFLEELYPPRAFRKANAAGKPGEEDNAASLRADTFTQIIDLGKYLYSLLFDDVYAELRDDREAFAMRIKDLWKATNDAGWATQAIENVSKELVEFWERLQDNVSRAGGELGVTWD